MTSRVNIAVTDFGKFEGNLILDVADENETCAGMGGRQFVAKNNEIVLRDEKGIVCVLCQGADEKTRVSKDTEDVLLYAYAVPGIDRSHLKYGLEIAADALVEFGGGKLEFIEIY